MRREPTPFEVIAWQNLSRSQLCSFKFRRQHVIYPYIVDFYCPSKSLIVEIDGKTHEFEKDAARDERLLKKANAILHFTNEDVAKNIDGVVQAIAIRLKQLPDRWTRARPPHPNPSPEGEGLS